MAEIDVYMPLPLHQDHMYIDLFYFQEVGDASVEQMMAFCLPVQICLFLLKEFLEVRLFL